jgi:hypothetical protein
VPKPVPIVEEELADEADDDAAAAAQGTPEGSGAEGASGNGNGNGNGNDGQSQPGRAEQLAANAEQAANAGSDADAETGEGGLVAGLSIYCYTVDVEADGWMEDLFTFLEATKSITALEVVSYSYTEPPPQPENPIFGDNSDTQNTPTEPESGTIILQLRLYVFVEGGVTASSEE